MEDKSCEKMNVCRYCNVEMNAVGLGVCNGWRCPKCGHENPDLASYKMSEEIPTSPCQCLNCESSTPPPKDKSCENCFAVKKEDRNSNVSPLCNGCGEYKNWQPIPTPNKMIEVDGRCDAGADGDFPCTTIGGGQCENLDVNSGCKTGFSRKVKINPNQSAIQEYIKSQNLIPITDAVKYVEIDREKFISIICEHRPTACLDSGQPEWCRKELNECYDDLIANNPLKLKQGG